MRIPRFCLRLLLILSAGVAAFFVSFEAFNFVTANLLHPEADELRRASLEGTVGFPFAALSALLSAYVVSRLLQHRGAAERAGR